ncbi:ABC transporter ATP-binding protein [Xanthomonas campestris pv. campestris]|uniref:ABC transporter permease and ATP-binding protein n=1 Tax=Xanthomonas campestris pv. campestris (strain B100) TaxID=509169 RepID=B0RQZ3_XANCB|nr:ABC transporter ATP-binding protein [Xanthomonas campestris]MCC3255598.1 ABC transporter ATP-binding protein/permease [Xanthomonas campestris pv. armoraciae]MCD0252049.1 ABC transporter ATP-binding protein [Xanthomonas campestris pv. campestris]MCD0264795.1 ABC transporter ATP-binding protein [Xanthomonas campestris pv. campestris]MCD0272905.1 ABC transporter ATP-binding protein [Xanthomonas campestris pv. campestris]MCD0277313.1 ABC transporter ATP-binding protein [Xanthomonas campestris p
MFRWFESLIDTFPPIEREMPPRSVWRFYLHYLLPLWPILLATLIAGLLLALVEVAMFDFLGRIVDMLAEQPGPEFFRRHAGELVWMAAITLVARPFFTGLHNLLVNQAIVPGLSNRSRWLMHNYVVRQSLAFFHNDFAGRIANRVMQTGTSLRESAVQMVDALWYIVVYTGSALWLFAQADPWLMVPLLCWLVVYVGLMAFFVPRMKARAWVASDARSKATGRIVDGYTNIATLKLFSHARSEEAYVRDAIDELAVKHRLQTRVTTAMDTAIAIANGFLIVGTCGLALWLWSRGQISVGAITLATGLVIRIHNMSGWIMWTVNGIFEDIGSVQDGMQTIAQPLTVQDQPTALPLQVTRGAVHFDQIHFHYGKRGGVIAGLDLQVRAGEKIGLVGPSGAGKSTLVNVLLRLYDLEQGRILIDGQDIAQVTQESLRGQIGLVTQDTSLLHRSIRDNLLYGRPQATEAQLLDAVHKARADGFIDTLVDGEGRRGFDAHVGERGVKLSGGQRQRIAIARVLLKDAPILILDEATSALDSEVEAAIQDSLDALMSDKTVIAIAHRLSTIARMDRLVVMDGGRIVETGTHAELIAHGGLYARLWARQTGGFVAADA